MVTAVRIQTDVNRLSGLVNVMVLTHVDGQLMVIDNAKSNNEIQELINTYRREL